MQSKPPKACPLLFAAGDDETTDWRGKKNHRQAAILSTMANVCDNALPKMKPLLTVLRKIGILLRSKCNKQKRLIVLICIGVIAPNSHGTTIIFISSLLKNPFPLQL